GAHHHDRRPGRARRGHLHPPPRADGPGHLRHHLRPPQAPGRRARPARALSLVLREEPLRPRDQPPARDQGLRLYQLLRHHSPPRPRPDPGPRLPRQPHQGRRGRGRAELQPDARLPGGDGAVMSVPYRRITVEEYEAMLRARIFTEADELDLIEGMLVRKITERPKHSTGTIKARRAIERALPAGWHMGAET